VAAKMRQEGESDRDEEDSFWLKLAICEMTKLEDGLKPASDNLKKLY
jgi:hypothetical protein